jgi:hypothetical protein
VAERTRLARDLHDAVTQTLFSASLIADVLPDLWDADPADGRQSTEELRQLTRGADPIRLAAYGALAGLPSFAAVVFAAPLDAGWLFRVGACGIGFGGGLFAVGTLSAAMQMEEGGFVGMALGAWGAVQSASIGMSTFLGGGLRDAVSTLASEGVLGSALASPVTGYTVGTNLVCDGGMTVRTQY